MGWKFSTLLVLAGALCALAQPPLHIIPVLFIGFSFLLWSLNRLQRRRQALLAGWLFGFGYFAAGLYWLGLPVVIDVPDDQTKDLLLVAGLVGVPVATFAVIAILRPLIRRPWIRGLLGLAIVLAVWIALAVSLLPGRFTWMIPFNVFGLGALLATTTAVAALLSWISTDGGVRRALALAAAWAALEWIRGTILSGFPWNPVATAWIIVPEAAQSAGWWGPFGLSLVTVLLASLPAVLIRKEDRTGPAIGWTAGLSAAGIACLGFGFLTVPASVPDVPKVKMRIVQGAVAQRLKWQRGAREKILVRYGNLTLSKGIDDITHVIWPETAVPYRLQTQYGSVRLAGSAREFLLATIPKNGVLITGANRDVGKDTWNSVHVVDKSGTLISTYDKHHLVPFGEYVPARSFLSRIGVAKIAHGRGDYSFGPGPRSIKIPGAPDASPLVCYEAIFPAEAVGKKRPGWLLNVTNDAWFGNSAGPYQHFASARMRAIEQGLPLVRAANTGISAVVDPYGRVREILDLGKRGFIDAALPQARSPTLYSRYGDIVLLVWILIVVVIAIISPTSSFRSRNGVTARTQRTSFNN